MSPKPHKNVQSPEPSTKKENLKKNKYRGPTSDYEQDEFNKAQNFLYKRALIGLPVYSQEELDLMHWDKKKRIQKVHKRTQLVLNLWKQELVNKYLNNFFTKVFYKSTLIEGMIAEYGDNVDSTYISKISFKFLGITKKDIVNKLIEEKILPYNFYELK